MHACLSPYACIYVRVYMRMRVSAWLRAWECVRMCEHNYIYTSKIPVRWPGQCYGFTLSLIFKYCGGI